MISANSEQRTLIDIFSEHSFLNRSVLVNGQIHSEEQILMFRICESREKGTFKLRDKRMDRYSLFIRDSNVYPLFSVPSILNIAK